MTAVGSYNGFIAKIDAQGQRKRAKPISNDFGDGNKILAIDTDKENNIYLGGINSETAYRDSINILSMGGDSELFVVKIDTEGTFIR
jgi:hypothetical protein